MQIRELEPKSLWGHFADLNACPRPSKKEQAAVDLVKAFGERLGLPTTVDAVGNVIITKPATPGMEGRAKIVMQGHLDMVCQKNEDTNFDFETEGIRMGVDGDWVSAEGTTLGADNGIGVAATMAILESDSIAHPAIEALFTIDEETGMTGAQGLEPGQLSGKILLNLDTEDDDELTIGCAGGIDITARMAVPTEAAPQGAVWKLSLRGLQGGHSGIDIHLGRGNANKLMNRVLRAVPELRLAHLSGGSLRNAIPRESFATVVVTGDEAAVRAKIDAVVADLKAEHSTTDPDLRFDVEPAAAASTVVTPAFQKQLIAAVGACPNGIHRMSPDIENLVQTSNNLARVLLEDGRLTVMCLTRSAVDTEKMDHARAIEGVFELLGAKVELTGSYPGWTPRPEASIIRLMETLYESRFGKKPGVVACHAGLECGIIGRHYPDMEMISFGPNIRAAHSPDEKVQISSVQKFWGLLLETLEKIPAA